MIPHKLNSYDHVQRTWSLVTFEEVSLRTGTRSGTLVNQGAHKTTINVVTLLSVCV